MVPRGRSVPAVTPTSSDLNNGSIAAVVPSPSSVSVAPQNAHLNAKSNSKLMAQAEALARMTFELNLRALSSQAERLEKDLKALVMCTAQDKDFRENYERRLQDMWQEILVVKNHMSKVQGTSKTDYEQCQRDTSHSIEQLRQEMGQLKGSLSDISSTLDRLPSAAEADSMLAAAKTGSSSQIKASQDKSQFWPQTSNNRTISKKRIHDALSSTRRWNRDYKTTSLSDALFATNYLRQQSKRDPHVAVYIQRAIQRHINRSGRSHSKPRPKTLEQFCQDVTWKDVIEAIEEALVKDEEGALKALVG